MVGELKEFKCDICGHSTLVYVSESFCKVSYTSIPAGWKLEWSKNDKRFILKCIKCAYKEV